MVAAVSSATTCPGSTRSSTTFPAALLVAAVIFEILFLLTKRDSLRVAAYWTLLAGVIGAGLAVLTGLGAEDHIAHGDAVHEIMEEHEELAYITTGIFAVVGDLAISGVSGS